LNRKRGKKGNKGGGGLLFGNILKTNTTEEAFWVLALALALVRKGEKLERKGGGWIGGCGWMERRRGRGRPTRRMKGQ
jgi:hypothetical protein